MSILNIRNPETGEWESVPSIVGPPGPQGDTGAQGIPGNDGEKGEDGYTPVKGVDYCTPDEKAEFEAYIATELAKRGQLKPEFANSIEECTDTSKLYVLPDGYIYAYMKITTQNEPKNLLPLATDTDRVTIYNGVGYATDTRLSSSGSTVSHSGVYATGFIPAVENDVLTIQGLKGGTTGTAMYLIAYDANNTQTGYKSFAFTEDGIPSTVPTWYTVDQTNNIVTIPLTSDIFGSGFNAVRFSTKSVEGMTAYINKDSQSGITTATQWTSTGHAFVPADYEDRIIDLEEAVEELKVAADVEADSELMYIAPDGDDSNSGLSADAPKKTVKACISAGVTRISAKRGVYAERVSLSNIDSLEIFPTDNDQEFSKDASWQPIVFDLSDTLAVDSLESYNAINRIAYSNSANEQFNKVFTAQSQSPVIGEYGSRYNATVWLMSSDEKAVCIKLKPVLTVAECEAEANTFSYVDGYIYINADMTGVEKIVVPTNWNSGFRITDAGKVVLREVEVRFSGSYNVWILNCPHFEMYKCSSKYTSYGSGFDIDNANGVFTSCYATKNFDGFGISGYGHTTFVDCVSEFNFDDGVSHHNGTEGTFIGGRYEGNGKGGNTPAYGAKVNIYGGIYKDNASFGIGYLYTSTHNPSSGTIENAIIVGNKVGLKVDANCTVVISDCYIKNNDENKNINGTLTEYNVSSSTDKNPDGGDDTVSPTNLLPFATDEDRETIFNGIGYKDGIRLSSSGTVTSAAGNMATGFIPAKEDQILYIQGVTDGTANMYVIAYDASNTKTGYLQYVRTTVGTLDERGFIYTESTDTFYIPLSAKHFGTGFNAIRICSGSFENAVITVVEKEDDSTGVTEEEAIAFIKNWDKPLYDSAPVTLIDDDKMKPALTTEDRTIEAIYAKYRALMEKFPRHITETNLGKSSSSDTFEAVDILRFDFKEPDGLTNTGYTLYEQKPKLIFMSGVHTEWVGVWGLYYALEEIMTNPDFDDIRRNAHIIVVPCSNPFCLTSQTAIEGWRMSHVNANGVAIHNNFNVEHSTSGTVGEYNYGGPAPCSELETQYIDKIMAENPDAAAFVSCHNNDYCTEFGTSVIWASSATAHMCNVTFRLIDKLSKAWLNKYGDTLIEAIENYKTDALEDGDYRLGRAQLSTSKGTEAKNALKYGIQGVNVEISRMMKVFSGNVDGTSEVMTHGAEVYANWIRTLLASYDYKDKKEYALMNKNN